MAILYRAYTFNPAMFFDKLTDVIIDGGSINTRALYELAQKTVHNKADSLRELLVLLRFDEEWLDDSDKEVSRSHLWFLLALAPMLKPVPSTKEIAKHYLILPRLLPLLNWTEEQIILLIQGRPLHTLIEEYGNQQFIDEFSAGINAYGGWLSPIISAQLLSELQATTNDRLLIREATQVQSSHDLPENYHSELRLQDSLDEAQYILRTAVERQESLFLIMD